MVLGYFLCPLPLKKQIPCMPKAGNLMKKIKWFKNFFFQEESVTVGVSLTYKVKQFNISSKQI